MGAMAIVILRSLAILTVLDSYVAFCGVGCLDIPEAGFFVSLVRLGAKSTGLVKSANCWFLLGFDILTIMRSCRMTKQLLITQ